MEENASINKLPNEILIEIFEYLSVEQVLNISRVCTRWEDLVRDRKLWRHLVYRPDNNCAHSHIINVLKQTPHLRRFFPLLRCSTGRLLDAIAAYCKDMRKLQLCRNSADCTSLRNLVLECGNLEELSAVDDDFAASEFLNIISKCLKLKSLKLIGDLSLHKPDVFADISQGCPSLEKLDLLNLEKYNIDDLESLLKCKENLTYLSVQCCVEEQRCSLPVIFENCYQLITLYVTGHKRGPFAYNSGFFNNMRKLKKLFLRKFKCSDMTYVIHYFEAGLVLNLVVLDLSYFENIEKRLTYVIYTKCINLKKLYFECCYMMTDDCLENIWNLTHLEYLSLDNCKSITDNGVSYLIGCKNLMYLNLNDCTCITRKSFVICLNDLMLCELYIDVTKVDYEGTSQISTEPKGRRTLNLTLKGASRASRT